MEVKKASPSAGAFCPDADPAALATVLCGCSLGDQRAHRRPLFRRLAGRSAPRCGGAYDGPILAKDFIVDPRQVAEARLHGADAVLAMLSVLDDAEARAVMAEAERLGMEVLVEAHDESEVRRGGGARRAADRHQQSRSANAGGRSRHHRAAGAAGAARPAGRRGIGDRRAAATSSGSRRTPTPSWSAPP